MGRGHAHVPAQVLHRRRRAIALTSGFLISVLAIVGTKAAVTPLVQLQGEKAWRAGDPVAAARWFGYNERLNLAERWIAPYNNGVAAYGRRAWLEAADWFEVASRAAPQTQLCRVVLNQALALEAAGDAQERSGDQAMAAARFGEAQRALAQAGDCGGSSGSTPPPPKDDSSGAPPPEETEALDELEETAERLTDKLSGGRERPAPSGTRSDSERAEQMAQELAERNSAGARQQQQAEDDSREAGEEDDSGRNW